jgi:hypothetical protein
MLLDMIPGSPVFWFARAWASLRLDALRLIKSAFTLDRFTTALD